MSGGFFRGTSADQDTRFSNKQAKLLKSQKFAPELDHLVDITKVKMDVIRPWIATRATELLGFEDEVLINFVYGLLDGKVVDGKKIQIQLTGFMEKNTGKFMRELWALLLSAQNNASGIPQQFLDAKEEEIKNRKAENDRITQELQRTKEKGRLVEEERSKRMDEESAKAGNAGSGPASRNSVPRASSHDSREERDIEARGGLKSKSRRSSSPSRSFSKSDSKSGRLRDGRQSRSISVSSKSVSHSPSPKRRYNSSTRRSISPARRSVSPRPKYSPRDTSPLKRRSPYTRRSPSISRHRSPSPRRRRSPYFRRRSPSFSRRRSPPLSRRSPPMHRRSPPLRRRSPSPLRHRSPPLRRRSPPLRHRSPPRRRSPPLRRRSPSPMHHRSPPMRRRSPSPLWHRSPPMRRLSPSPVRQRSPYQSNRSPSYRSPTRLRSLSPAGHRSPSPIRTSPVHRSPRHQNRSPLYSPKMHGADSRISPNQRKRNRSPSRSSSPPYRQQMRLGHDTVSRTNGFDAKRLQDENTPERSYKKRSLDPQHKASYPGTNRSCSFSESPSRDSRYKKDDTNFDLQTEKAPVRSNLQSDLQRASPREIRARSFSGSPVRQSAKKQSRGDKQIALDRKDVYRKDDSLEQRSRDARLDKKNQSSYAIDYSPRVYSPDRSPVKHDYAPKDRHGKENEQKSHKDLVGPTPVTKSKSLEVEYGPGRTKDKHTAKDDKYDEPHSARRSKRKIEQSSLADSSDKDSQDTDTHRHRDKEKRSYKKHDKHKRESDYSSESASDIEDRKEAKKRRKEERKLRKEEKRRKREEKHQKRLERRAGKMKAKSIDTGTPPTEHEDYNDEPKSENEGSIRKVLQSADAEAEFDQKKLEIELREKALETLRAKKRAPI